MSGFLLDTCNLLSWPQSCSKEFCFWCTGSVRSHIRGKNQTKMPCRTDRKIMSKSQFYLHDRTLPVIKEKCMRWYTVILEVMGFAQWLFHKQSKKTSYTYTELKKWTICCLLTKKGGGSDRSLKGLDDIFVKVNDGGLNNTLAKVACKMKGEGIASVSGCIGNQKKKKKKNLSRKLLWKSSSVKDFRREFPRYCKQS